MHSDLESGWVQSAGTSPGMGSGIRGSLDDTEVQEGLRVSKTTGSGFSAQSEQRADIARDPHERVIELRPPRSRAGCGRCR